MMLVAEISDKMGSVAAAWALWLSIGLGFSLGALLLRRAVVPVLAVGAIFFAAVWALVFREICVDPVLSGCVRAEMGTTWTLNILAASACPALFATTAMLFDRIRRTSGPAGAR